MICVSYQEYIYIYLSSGKIFHKKSVRKRKVLTQVIQNFIHDTRTRRKN